MAWVVIPPAAATITGIPAPDDPETASGGGPGDEITNPNNREFYAVSIGFGDSVPTFHTPQFGGANPTQASLAWFKMTLGGQNGIDPSNGLILDTFGSTAAFSFGGLSGQPGTALAIYDADGNFIVKQDNVRAGVGDEPNNIGPDITPMNPGNNPDGTSVPGLPGMGNREFNQPNNPIESILTNRVQDGLGKIESIAAGVEPDGDPIANVTLIDHDGDTFVDFDFQREIYRNNSRGISQLSFLKSPDDNPLWDPGHPDHDPDADWDEFPINILPFDVQNGTDYFVAVTGAARFSGLDSDEADRTPSVGDFVTNGNVDQGDKLRPVDSSGNTVRFGFTSIHPNEGIIILNLRVPGDFTGNMTTDDADIDMLFDRIAALSVDDGLDPNFPVDPDDWSPETDWTNAADMVHDITGNSRVDMGDMDMVILSVLGTNYGDLDLDGVVDATDQATLEGNLGMSGGWADGDVNGDDMVTQADLDILLANLPALLGDANKDGQVTGADLISVQQNFGNVGPTPLQGDANNDGQVTGADLISVQQNFGNVAAASAAVPEPGAAALWLAGAALVLRRRRRGTRTDFEDSGSA